MDRSAVEYVNWEKGEPTVLFDEYCVDMDVSSGTWRTYYCSVDQNFICKVPKSKFWISVHWVLSKVVVNTHQAISV